MAKREGSIVTNIILTSPLGGWAAPLDEVPDPVFAQRMLGDGIAIDPTGGTLHAPCDGTVLNLHASRHAITLLSDEGVEILMHIGVDSVALGGNGFAAHVAQGDRVKRCDPLISFDLEALLPQVPAVITPILITNADRFTVVKSHVGQALAVGEWMMTLQPRDAAVPVAATAGEERRMSLTLGLAHGLHARPAGRIAELTRRFEATVTLWKGDRQANGRSAVSILTLGAKFGDAIDIAVTGPDAQAALEAICALIAGGMGEGRAPRQDKPSPATPLAKRAVDGILPGVMAAPGKAVGTAIWLRETDRAVAEHGLDPAIERRRLAEALDTAVARLGGGAGAAGAILDAHRALLEDPELRAQAESAITAGHSAEWAWRGALREQAVALRQIEDARLAERADDLIDVERQVLAALAGEEPATLAFPEDTILLAEDLLPSHLLRIGAGGIAGFCTMRGGPTSHVAILAAGMGIPGLVAMGESLGTVNDGAALVLDAQGGALTVDPAAPVLETARAAIAEQARQQASALAMAAESAIMLDGTPIEVFANLGSQADAALAVAHGAEGCGLLRTEFLFLDRPAAPSEAEQAADYQAIADALGGRPLIVRLLDIGGDKPAAYLPMAAEENPALGLRGIRVGLAHRALLDAQLRAILRVAPLGQCRIMVPMITGVDELLAVREALDEARRDLGITGRIELGVMIETPAAAITADLIASHADFLSIGTNDLTQYVLAMDRGNPAVASGIDGLHPAVLRMIAQTCQGGRRHGRWTGVCGGLASDLLAIPILIGLGVTELSATPALVPQVKAAVRAVSADTCRSLAEEALAQPSAQAVRALVHRFQQEIAR
jgi:phosphocarrier protein FPr/phosphocarrier protein